MHNHKRYLHGLIVAVVGISLVGLTIIYFNNQGTQQIENTQKTTPHIEDTDESKKVIEGFEENAYLKAYKENQTPEELAKNRVAYIALLSANNKLDEALEEGKKLESELDEVLLADVYFHSTMFNIYDQLGDKEESDKYFKKAVDLEGIPPTREASNES